MGFDLSAKNRGLGGKGYFRADVYQMILLRASMIAAGVNETVVYKKFVSNDGYLVTPLQSSQISDNLIAWLRNRDLTLDLCETNERAKKTNAAYFALFSQLGDRETKTEARHFSRAKTRPIQLDSSTRSIIRKFADFCGRSGGF